MEKFFKLGLRGTDKKTEIIAGLTTFMTMAYVLAVQPAAICGGEAYITDVNGVVITKSAIMITCALVSGLTSPLRFRPAWAQTSSSAHSSSRRR